jgi:hypothetical protein
MESVLKDHFVMSPDERNVFETLSTRDANTKGRVNVLFTIGYYNANYYYLSQLLSLAKLFEFNKNTFLYIIFSDTDIIYKKRKGPISEDELFLIEKNIAEMKTILVSFGAVEDNIFVYRLSEAFLRLLERAKKQTINLFTGLIRFPNSELKMSPEMAKSQYRPNNYAYTIAYTIRAFLDLILASSFPIIYPEDIEGKINIHVTGYGGSEITLKIKERLMKDDLVSNMPPTLLTLPLPCFGRGDKSEGKFCIPDWDMGAEEIYSVINQYHVPSNHINVLFSEFLTKNMKEFVTLKGTTAKTTSGPPNLSLYPIASQRLTLAHNLHVFMQEAKKKAHQIKTASGFLAVSNENEMKNLLRILKSKAALEILRLANGEYTLSEMSKKLDKHVSNVSRTVNELRALGLIKIDEKRKITKGVRTVKLTL